MLSNDRFGRSYCRLLLELDTVGSRLFAAAVPGQFAEIDLSRTSAPGDEDIPEKLADCASRQIILRRPFSFSAININRIAPPAVTAEILYCVLGPATLRMTNLKAGDRLSMIGPLGNGFTIPGGKNLAILIAGGMGAPPLLHLASHLRTAFGNIRTVTFAGARTAEDFPFTLENDSNDGRASAVFNGEAHLATDDGSVGYHGFVTACVRNWLAQECPLPEETVIFSCGPEIMLHDVAAVAAQYGIDAQVSMERMMACGIGLCQSCAVEVDSPSAGETEYKLCCKDGPVFDSTKVRFRL